MKPMKKIPPPKSVLSPKYMGRTPLERVPAAKEGTFQYIDMSLEQYMLRDKENFLRQSSHTDEHQTPLPIIEGLTTPFINPLIGGNTEAICYEFFFDHNQLKIQSL